MTYALVAIVALVAAILGFALTRPDAFRIERSILIAAPAERIQPLIADFRSWRNWSPWENKDPGMSRTLSGAEAGVGAAYAWEGNKDIGAGRMEILESSPQRILIKLDFLRPFGPTTAPSSPSRRKARAPASPGRCPARSPSSAS